MHKTAQEMWQTYSERMVAAGAPPQFVDAMEGCFYSGALAVLTRLAKDSRESDALGSLVRELHDEVGLRMAQETGEVQ